MPIADCAVSEEVASDKFKPPETAVISELLTVFNANLSALIFA